MLEHNPQIARKILISGGGRCNFTNLHTTAENFVSANPHFAKSALARYTPRDFIAMVERHGIPYHEKTLGQLFCDRAATEIVQMLEVECAAAGSVSRRRAPWPNRQNAGRRVRSGDIVRDVPMRGAGGRDRRTFDSENGRHAVRL